MLVPYQEFPTNSSLEALGLSLSSRGCAVYSAHAYKNVLKMRSLLIWCVQKRSEIKSPAKTQNPHKGHKPLTCAYTQTGSLSLGGISGYFSFHYVFVHLVAHFVTFLYS